MTQKRPSDPMAEIAFVERNAEEGLAACDELLRCGCDPVDEGPDPGRGGVDSPHTAEGFDVTSDPPGGADLPEIDETIARNVEEDLYG